MMRAKHLVFLLVPLLAFTPGMLLAQNTDWLENTMYSSGKINVVTGVIAAVFVFIVVYLISLERKLKKIEKKEDLD